MGQRIGARAGEPGATVGSARERSISARRAARYAGASSPSTGTEDAEGSATYASASANARRIASTTRCQRPAESGGQRREIETVEDAEREQRREALPVRRALPDAETAEADADRVVPRRAVRCQVVRDHHAAGALHGRGEVAPDLSAVERVRPALRDGPKRPCQARVAERLARPRPAAVDRHGPAARRPCEDPLGPARPVEGRERGHGHTVFREADRGSERIGDTDAPVTGEQVAPPRARSGNGDRVRVARVGELRPVGVLPRRVPADARGRSSARPAPGPSRSARSPGRSRPRSTGRSSRPRCPWSRARRR